LKAYKSIGKLFDYYGTASELRGILGGWTYLFFHASFTLISTIFADNVLGVKEVRRSRIWTERSEVFYTVLSAVLSLRQLSKFLTPLLAP
jgi:hypothetical protein